MLARPGALLANDAGDPKLGRFEDALLLKKLPRLGIEGGGLLQTPGLLEQKLLQLRRFGVTEMAQPEVTNNDLYWCSEIVGCRLR